MAIGQWFNEGASAQSAGVTRDSCPYEVGDARSEWLSGFDEAVTFMDDTAADEVGRSDLLAVNSHARD